MATISEISAGSAGITVLGTDTTGGASTSSTLTKISEVAIAGGAVSEYILVKILCRARSVGYGGLRRKDAQIDLRIGESGSEASVNDFPMTFKDDSSSTTAGVLDNANYQTIEYYYEPTVDEKANGFNIQVFGGYAAVGVDPGLTAGIDVYQTIVSGL